jgi:hypothetical protein
MAGATYGTGTAFPSGAPPFTPRFLLGACWSIFQDTKGAPEVANRRRTDNTMAKNRQKDKQQSSKHHHKFIYKYE